VGYLGFDCVRYFEDVPLAEKDAMGHPEAIFVFAREVYIYDHVTRRLSLVIQVPLHGDRAAHHANAVSRLEAAVAALAAPAPQLRPLPVGTDEGALPAFVSNRSQRDMEEAVERARQAIAAGEVFQVVLSQRFTVHDAVDPLTLYRALRALNPSPYMFLFRLRDFALVGASPEVLVRVEDDDIFLRPIAGTRPRGRDDAEDQALEAELLADEKELAEHRMLVDLGRNDVGRVAAIGTVRLDDPLHIERYAHVMHIVSDVHGRLAEGKDCFDVLRACFPAGTVSGAPKVRACELIAQLEPDRRGVYAGAVGYFGDNGNMDLCIAIRSLVAEADRVSTQAGAGVVWDSVPAREHEECLHKARSGLRAIGLAQRWGHR
jgi:anthranilate synthase component 1